MLKSLLVLAFLLFAQTAEPAIFSPQANDLLRGQVAVVGNLDVENFSSAELAFSYASGSDQGGQGWFLLQSFTQIPVDQNLVTWDTTLVTDGDYDLHLRVYFTDGTSRDVVVSGLRIRNDVTPATATPTSTPEEFQIQPTATLPSLDPYTPTPVFPTPTPLPPNPVTITTLSIFDYFARGGLIAIVVILLLSLILRSRRN